MGTFDPSRVAPVPLFDRLVDREPWGAREVRPQRTLDEEGLLASVQREAERLLGTRCALPLLEAEALPSEERSVIDYGLPDLGSLHPDDPGSRERLAGVLARALSAFEPRLRQVRVSVERLSVEERRVEATVHALLVKGRLTEPVSFPISGEVIHGREP